MAATLVWVVSPRVALAAAPLCDARGAIMFAPNPTLEDPNVSIDIGEDADCLGTERPDFALDRGQSPTASASVDDLARASLSTALVVMPATPTASVSHIIAHFEVPSGVHVRVDRPPRF